MFVPQRRKPILKSRFSMDIRILGHFLDGILLNDHFSMDIRILGNFLDGVLLSELYHFPTLTKLAKTVMSSLILAMWKWGFLTVSSQGAVVTCSVWGFSYAACPVLSFSLWRTWQSSIEFTCSKLVPQAGGSPVPTFGFTD